MSNTETDEPGSKPHPVGVNVVVTGGKAKIVIEASNGEMEKFDERDLYPSQAMRSAGSLSEILGVPLHYEDTAKLN